MRKIVSTGSGMFALWDRNAFSDVVDYDTWESRLLDDADIERESAAGRLVPVNIRSDGIFDMEARAGTRAAPAALSERESAYVAASAPASYLLRTTGVLHFGGIEQIHAQPVPETGALSIEAGDYAVRVHLIDWPQEPGMTRPDGTPADGALPDFIVLIDPVGERRPERVSVDTFG